MDVLRNLLQKLVLRYCRYPRRLLLGLTGLKDIINCEIVRIAHELKSSRV